MEFGRQPGKTDSDWLEFYTVLNESVLIPIVRPLNTPNVLGISIGGGGERIPVTEKIPFTGGPIQKITSGIEEFLGFLGASTTHL
jgi:hypothetical protein